MVSYYFDTYALILLLNGDERIRYYLESKIITSTLNLMELYYYLLRKNVKEPEKIIEEIRESSVIISDFPLDVVIKASKLRFKKRKENKKWSYVDCLGYTIAKDLGIRFLTGDKKFENEENVEFIKST
jgi:predicted nucleic acid-binding protein